MREWRVEMVALELATGQQMLMEITVRCTSEADAIVSALSIAGRMLRPGIEISANGATEVH